MANVVFDVTRYYQIAQDLTGVQYLVQDGNWYLRTTQVAINIIPNGWKFLPVGSSGTFPGNSLSILAQTAIPVIFVSSGSIGNNGALSGLTALPTTYANCYVALPAGALFAGSLAGVYFCQMSGTTAGTVFNNVYSAEQPTIPASPVPFVSTGPGAYTQTTGSPVTLYTFTVPANVMGPNGAIYCSSVWSYNNSAGNKTLNIKYGGTNLTNATGTTTTTNNAPNQIMQNRGLTNSQVVLAGTLAGGASAGALVYSSVDTTASQQLLANAQLATATDFLLLERLSVMLYPAA